MVAGVTDGGVDPILTRLVAQDKVPWYKKPNLRMLYLLLFPACMGVEMTSGWDSQMINAAQIVPQWQAYFHKPTGALNGIISASYSLGAICGLPFIPFINDRFGRRWCIFFGSCVMVVGSFLSGFAQNVAMYIISRMVLGFGIPFCIVAASSLIGELGYPKERPILTSLFNSSYFIGAIVAAGVTFGTSTIKSNWAWRAPCLMQFIPSLLQIAFIFFLPESPRFLVSKDRHDEALAILVKYHAEGDASSEFVKAEMAQIEATIKIEQEMSKQSWADVLRTAGNRRRLLVGSFLGLFTQWSGNTLISYYLNDILNMAGYTHPNFKFKYNLGNNCWALVNATAIALVVRRFRRRVMYLTCVIAILTVYTGWTIANARFKITGSIAAGKLILFFIYAYSPCYNIGYNALTYTYLVELFPYTIRSRGISVFQFFGRGAGFFSTFVNPIGLKAIGWKYLLVFVCWVCFEIVIIWFLFPETGGKTLEELAFLFESDEMGKEVNRQIVKQVGHHVEDIDGGVAHAGKKDEEVAAEKKAEVVH